VFGRLQIDGDPTLWWLRQPVDAGELTGPGGPQSIDVISPLNGTLLLSATSAASLALANPPVGAIPTDAITPTPVLYLPLPGGFTDVSDGYPLPAGTDLEALKREITAAMSGGSRVAVGVHRMDAQMLVLNGAALPFAIVCPANPAG
jgi:hypothetical protein